MHTYMQGQPNQHEAGGSAHTVPYWRRTKTAPLRLEIGSNHTAGGSMYESSDLHGVGHAYRPTKSNN